MEEHTTFSAKTPQAAKFCVFLLCYIILFLICKYYLPRMTGPIRGCFVTLRNYGMPDNEWQALLLSEAFEQNVQRFIIDGLPFEVAKWSLQKDGHVLKICVHYKYRLSYFSKNRVLWRNALRVKTMDFLDNIEQIYNEYYS